MKVLFLTNFDPRDKPLLFSGTALSMLQGLQFLGYDVHVQTIQFTGLARLYGVIKWRIYRWFFKKQFQFEHDPILIASARRQLKKQLRDEPFDIIFTWFPWYLGYVDSDKPKVYWYDTTFIKTAPLYYPDLCKESYRHAIQNDTEIARHAAAAIYSSQWACDSAINDYNVDSAHVHFIRLGSNFEAASPDMVNQAIERRLARAATEPLRLLFVGFDWKRKGGDVAVEVVAELNRRRIPAKLSIVGANPVIAPQDAPFVDVVGPLNKSDPNELQRLKTLYLESDFFIMTSRGDSSPIVYCEAMANGTPNLATRIGGVESIVRNDVTGCIVDWGDHTVTQLADYVIALHSDPDRYRALCKCAYETFFSDFNWQKGWARLGEIMGRIVHEGRSP